MAAIASRQHGVVTRAELLGAGLTSRQIERRLERGALLRQHPGVYRAGHRAPSVEATFMAAVKAHGPATMLAGRAAGWLLRLVKGRPPAPEVIAPKQRRVPGVASRRAHGAARTTYRGVPVTTVTWTLVDLAAVIGEEDLARACHEAGALHRTTPRHLEAMLARRPNAKGAGALRRVLFGEVPVTLSQLEARFLAVLSEHGLPLPVTNKLAGERRIDCRWPGHALTVELDSYRFHSSRFSWEEDREREREARRRGDEFRRFTYDDVFVDLRYMLGQLGGLLA